MELLGPDGATALAAAAAESDPTSLAAGERLRKRFPAALAAAALSQVSLRRRGLAKLGREDLFLTSAGLEQATRPAVAAWRAARFAAAGMAQVWDLGCGLGIDSIAFEAAGLRAYGVELDPTTAAYATANLALGGGSPVQLTTAEAVVVPAGGGVFLDPARRTGAGRTWRVEDFTPPWSLVARYLGSEHFTAVKLGPGLPKELIPEGVQAAYVSHGGEVVEVSLWNRLSPGPVAVVFPRAGGVPIELTRDAGLGPLPIGPIGSFIIEPDNAVIRSGLIAEAVAGNSAWLLEEQVAYLSAETALESPLVDNFEVSEVLDFDTALLRRHLAQHRIGTVEIKKRAIDVDPAQLRRRLRPSGPHSATILLVRTPSGARAVLARRLARSQP